MIYYKRSDALFLMGDFKESLVIKVNGKTNDNLSALSNEIAEAFDSLTFGKIVIGVKMPDIIGGYYTKKLHCPGIYLPQSINTCTIDEKNQKFIIDFTPDNFSTFVHEANHFLHLERDHGMWLQPLISIEPLTDLKLLVNSGVKTGALYRRCAELEAGYRSVRMIKKYNLSSEYGKLNFLAQISNLLVYDINKQTWYKKYIKIYSKLKSNKDRKRFLDKFVDKFAEKYSMFTIDMNKMELPETEVDSIFKEYENV